MLEYNVWVAVGVGELGISVRLGCGVCAMTCVSVANRGRFPEGEVVAKVGTSPSTVGCG